MNLRLLAPTIAGALIGLTVVVGLAASGESEPNGIGELTPTAPMPSPTVISEPTADGADPTATPNPTDEPAARVDICHVPPGNPENQHTIAVEDEFVADHLEHGDTEGPCTPTDPPAPPDGASGKVDLCHVPPGNPDNAHAISVGASALESHLSHGDAEGDCP